MPDILNQTDLLKFYSQHERTEQIIKHLNSQNARLWIKGLVGSSKSIIAASVFNNLKNADQQITAIHILPDKESAAYFCNDLENIFGELELPYEKKSILYYPASYKKLHDAESIDNANVLLRTEVINKLNIKSPDKSSPNLFSPLIVVTYPEALCEKIITRQYLTKNTLSLSKDEKVNIDFILDVLVEYGFERVDFVVEAGQFTIRGGIIDVFSFANDYPYRIEFSGDKIESLRTFDPVKQLSIQRLKDISIVPNLESRIINEKKESFLNYIPQNSIIWIDDIIDTAEIINAQFIKLNEKSNLQTTTLQPNDTSLITGNEFISGLLDYRIIETGKKSYFISNSSTNIKSDLTNDNSTFTINCSISPQPSFNKKFELFITELQKNSEDKITNIILSDSPKQAERLYSIIKDISSRTSLQKSDGAPKGYFTIINLSLHEGFIDKETGLACYTDHQLFERFHRYRLKDSFSGKEALNVKELYGLKPGDYVTHIDHGIGKFGGLEKIDVNGREQEAIRLLYKDGDILYISIHSLHRISKYIGKEGTEPVLSRLGSNAWNNLKNKTKQRVKDIAKDLIKLYAQRKTSPGIAFSPDSYLQTELEASFIYEDTPDQIKVTADVKKDMEADFPMDRLICGDVGFGKTEVAVRAAFKAVADSKQVALLVPTTILALQHYNTFRERLHELPCNVEYISRFRSTKTIHSILNDLEKGKVDIIIGTHKLLVKILNSRIWGC